MTIDLSALFDPWIAFVADEPAMRLVESGMILTGCLLIFFVFFTTRDIILRTHSFFYQVVCIALVALVPVVGFLLYMLIRPARTIKERELERMIHHLADAKGFTQSPVKKEKKKKPAKSSASDKK